MSMPFYVSPEQIIKDKADYARKGIARGRSVVVIQYANGIAFVAENPSRALHKISEIYDRIAFAAVGKYNEFESLRVAGVRLADTRGYSYDRKDVTGRGLANAYAQTLGTIFTENPKPFEVEIVVAEVGESAAEDQMYRLTFDGSVADEHGFVAMGGSAEAITAALSQTYTPGLAFPEALQVAVAAINAGRSSADPRPADGDGSDQDAATPDAASPIPAGQLEVAVLDRTRNRRLFQRITGARLEEVLNSQK
ncbi:MAG TPA: proteasome subunit alpha [Actinobacteria bacterium]|nr:proteasome subunit alpha [Actinomycetota bacterium]